MRAYLLCSFALAVLVQPCYGQVASDPKMAEQALSPYIGSKDPATVAGVVQEARQTALKILLNNPDRVVAATVVFNTGVTPGQLRAITQDAQVTAFEVGLKAPIGARGGVNSIIIGADHLTLVEGDLEHRLHAALAVARKEMLEMAKALPEEEREDYQAMALGPQSIYSVSIFGKAGHLRSLLERPDVAYFRVDPIRDIAEGYERTKEQNARQAGTWITDQPADAR